MLTVHGLKKRFGSLQAVNDVSLYVAKGEVLGFLGPNGSGKSTTMKMITGFLLPDAGQINVCNIDLLTDPTRAQQHIGYLPEGAPAYTDISVEAYLKFIANIRHFDRKQRDNAIAAIAERTNIADVLHQTIGTLSKGYQRRVGLAQALLHDPDVLVLDEPTDGLDPNQKYEVRNLIRDMSAQKSIILSTHVLEEVDAICDRVLVIAHGTPVANGTPSELAAQSRYHNAVVIKLVKNSVAFVREGLQGLPLVSAIEQNESAIDSDMIELTVLANSGVNLLPTISNQARDRAWPVQSIVQKEVDLNEVFRSLTTRGQRTKSTSIYKQIEKPDLVAGAGFKDVLSICKNELTHYFSTPIAYVIVIIFLVAAGTFAFFLGGFFVQRQADLQSFFQFHPWLYLFLVPAIAMRLWAEERRSGSVELLLTFPLTTAASVLGKYIAAWMVIGLALLLTTTFWISVNYLGSPDNAAIATGYLGSFLTAGGYLSIGAFCSALTRNQVIAFIISAALCFLFTASGLGLVQSFFSGWASSAILNAVANLSFLEHFKNMSRGVIDLSDVTFFVSTIAFFLFANVVAVERWKKE